MMAKNIFPRLLAWTAVVLLLCACDKGANAGGTVADEVKEMSVTMPVPDAPAAYDNGRARVLVEKYASTGRMSKAEFAEALSMLRCAVTEVRDLLRQAVDKSASRTEALENIGSVQAGTKVKYKYLEPLGKIMELATADEMGQETYTLYKELAVQMQRGFADIESRVDGRFPA